MLLWGDTLLIIFEGSEAVLAVKYLPNMPEVLVLISGTTKGKRMSINPCPSF